MLCFNCGAEVPDGSNFCFDCGAEIDITQCNDIEDTQINATLNVTPITPTNVTSIKKDSTSSKSFKFHGRTITFNEDIVEYNYIHNLFAKNAQKSTRKVIDRYKTASFDTLFSDVLPLALSEIRNSVQLGVNVLMEGGIDYIGCSQLAAMAYDFINPDEFIEHFIDQGLQIEQYARELEEYRGITRSNRSYWTGGGFGLKGAIKGAVTAGALNLGLNAFRSIGDSLTNGSDRNAIKCKKQALMDDRKNYQILASGVHDSCLGVSLTVCDILTEHGLLAKVSFNAGTVHSRAENHYRRAVSNKFSSSNIRQAIDTLCNCIKECPYDYEIYYMLYQCIRLEADTPSATKPSDLPSIRNNLTEIARYFNVDESLTNRIKAFYRTAQAEFNQLSERTLNDLYQKLKSAERLQQEYYSSEMQSQITRLKSLIERRNTSAGYNRSTNTNSNSSSQNNSGCFITSAVCNSLHKPDDCYELMTFRNFRDNWLAQQSDGQALIKEYYNIAPKIVATIDQSDAASAIYSEILTMYLQPCLSYIESKNYDECKNLYIKMVRALQAQYS